jgi:hypothetical protein
MQVWALRNPNGAFRAKFHRYDSYECAGRRMYEENYPDQEDYVLVDILELPLRQGACQFDCCFHGLPDATAVAARYGALPGRPVAPTLIPSPPQTPAIRVGQRVTYQEVGSAETKTWTIVDGRQADRAAGEISAGSPIAAALLGRAVGDRVTLSRPVGPIELEIVDVSDSES